MIYVKRIYLNRAINRYVKTKKRGCLKSYYNSFCQVELVETDIDYQ